MVFIIQLFLVLIFNLNITAAQNELKTPSTNLNNALKLFKTPPSLYCRRFSPPVAPEIHPQPIDDKFIASQCKAIRGSIHISHQIFCLSNLQQAQQVLSIAVHNTGHGQPSYLKPDKQKNNCFSGKVIFGAVTGTRIIYYEAFIKAALTYAEIKNQYSIFPNNNLKINSIKILGAPSTESLLDFYRPLYNIDFNKNRISLEPRPFGKDDHFTDPAFAHQIRSVSGDDLIRITTTTFRKF